MRKLVISAFALAAMTSFAMAGEPVKLTTSQLDQVAAGNPCSKAFKSFATCIQTNWTNQTAVAVSGGGVFSGASASNLNATQQAQGDFNF
jgi:hypothetical protein